jgi:hypothetical protein
MLSVSPGFSAASRPLPSGAPLTLMALLPRSTTAKLPLRSTTCACTREIVRSGSGSTSWLVVARPMVPPSSSKLASRGSVGAPL